MNIYFLFVCLFFFFCLFFVLFCFLLCFWNDSVISAFHNINCSIWYVFCNTYLNNQDIAIFIDSLEYLIIYVIHVPCCHVFWEILGCSSSPKLNNSCNLTVSITHHSLAYMVNLKYHILEYEALECYLLQWIH